MIVCYICACVDSPPQAQIKNSSWWDGWQPQSCIVSCDLFRHSSLNHIAAVPRTIIGRSNNSPLGKFCSPTLVCGRALIRQSITHSVSHSLTLSHSLTHSLSHITHSLTHSLTGCASVAITVCHFLMCIACSVCPTGVTTVKTASTSVIDCNSECMQARCTLEIA
jgi:hypothetical protein